ncbi:MAG: protein kinase, partial [Gemmatimonadales bacterium]
DNVMLSGRHALVTDFGVAKAVSEATGRQTLTTAGVALGTPAYMAPEQAAADPHIDHRADIYALGALSYELLSGRPPFTGNSPQQVLAAHVTEPAEPVSRYRPGLPPPLAEAIMRCLAKRPADRWQSAADLVSRLESLTTPTGGMTPTDTAPVDPISLRTAHWRGHPVRVAGLFVLGGAIVLALVYLLMLQLGLPDWVPWIAAGLLAVGLPIMIATGLVERRRARARATGIYISAGERPLQRFFTWRRALLGGAVAFATLGVGTLGYTAMRLLGIGPVGTLVASGKLSSRDKVIVADFQNRSSDSTLAASVTEAFRIDLSQSPVVTLIGTAEMASGLQRMDRDPTQPVDAATARELAQREGAKAVVVGEVSPVGAGYVLSARLISPADGSELVALRETAEDNSGILAAIDRLSGRLRERIGESLKTIRAGEPLDQVTTSSLEALRLYSNGVKASDVADFDRSISLLRQAITLDSGFAMAWRKLAVVVGNSQGSLADEVEAATQAYRHRDRLPELERYQTIAYYYFSADYDPEKVVSAYRSILAIDPDETTALNNISILLNRDRRYAEAESLATRAIATGGAALSFYQNTIDAQLAQGKIQDALTTLGKLRETLPGNPVVNLIEGLIRSSYGSLDTAWVLMGRTEDWPPAARMIVNGNLAAMAAVQGRVNDAERLWRTNGRLADSRGLPGASLQTAAVRAATVARLLGSGGQARAILDSALQTHPLASIPAIERPYSSLAYAWAVAGEPGRARQLLSEQEARVPAGVYRQDFGRLAAAGEAALAEKKASEALRQFRAWRDASGCSNCGFDGIGRAFEMAGQPDSARQAYEREYRTPGSLLRIHDDFLSQASVARRLGELAEADGDRQKALEYYTHFLDLWDKADPELQPAVRDVRARVAELTSEVRSEK